MSDFNVRGAKLRAKLRSASKHFANFLHYPIGIGKEQRASDAENLFFAWLWRKG